jgi:hypothetical protein
MYNPQNAMWNSVVSKLPQNKIDVLILCDNEEEKVAWYDNKKDAWFSNGFLVIPNVLFWKHIN